MRSLAGQAAVAIRDTQLEDLSSTDGLTGVYHRRRFMLRFEEEGKRHDRVKRRGSLVLIDLDHFEEINDRFGHGAPRRQAARPKYGGRMLISLSGAFSGRRP